MRKSPQIRIMKNICKILLPILLIAPIVACGAAGTKVRGAGSYDKRTVGESKFTPLNESDDLNIVTTNVPEAREEIISLDNPVIESRISQPKQAEQYFSVQVYASKSSSDAEQFKNSIVNLFQDEVIIDYQPPYYRVCVGKASGYERGEELLKRVNAQGFPKAWLVRVRK